MKFPAELQFNTVKATTVDIKIFGTAEPAMSIIAASIPILRAFVQGKAPKSNSIPFTQFSHIPEPTTTGRSMPMFSSTSKKDSTEAFVHYPSPSSQASVATERDEVHPTTS